SVLPWSSWWTISALPGPVLVMVQPGVWRRPWWKRHSKIRFAATVGPPPHPRLDHHQNRTRQSTDRPARGVEAAVGEAAQQYQVRSDSGAAVGPVPDVVGLSPLDRAPAP